MQRAHHKQNTNENRLCRRVCMKMLNAKLSAAWEAWQEHNRLKLLLDRVGARWLKQGMVRCIPIIPIIIVMCCWNNNVPDLNTTITDTNR